MQNYSEELANYTDLIEKEQAKKSFYPNGTFAYSQAQPVVIKFPRPVHLDFVYLKKHRAPDFFTKKSKLVSVFRLI